MSDQGSTTYKHPGNLAVRLALFWITNSNDLTGQSQLNRAEEMLKEHGFRLDCWNSRTKMDQMTIPFEDRLVERTDYDYLAGKTRDILDDAAKVNYLPIIFCQFRFMANGLTVFDTPTKCLVKPFIMVDPIFSGGDKVTLLHEVGHAAGLDHDHTATNMTTRNFMNEAVTRTTMFKWQIQKMAQSFFIR